MPEAELRRTLTRLTEEERRAVDAILTMRLTHRQFAESVCNLTLSPMVAAIMDAAEGVPVTTIDDAMCERYFGCRLVDLPREKRRTVCVQAGGRGGKTSRLIATKALHAAWTVPIPDLARNEHAVALIVSSELVFARQALSFVAGYIQGSPMLRAAFVGDPDDPAADVLTLRRPDGKLVDIRVRAPGAKGKGGRAFTLVCALLDEACFFYDESGVINDKDIFDAVSPRVVEDGQTWLSSTPWIAGVGHQEKLLAENWGTHRRALAVRGVGTRALRPDWDPTGKIEADAREQDPDNADREIEAKPLTAGSSKAFAPEAVAAAFNPSRPVRLTWNPKYGYGAGGDTGFKKNSSALAIAERVPGEVVDGVTKPDRVRIALLEERRPEPGIPLKPKAVAHEFAGLMADYHLRELVVDGHEKDEVEEALREKNASAVAAPDKQEAFMLLRTLLHEGRLELPPNPRLKSQLGDVMSKPMPGGGTRFTSPQKADGSHGDLVSGVVNAVWKVMRGKTFRAGASASPWDSY